MPRGQPLSKKLLTFVFDGPAEGELSSVGWRPKAGACVGLCYLRGDAAQRARAGTAVHIDLWGAPVTATAWDHWPPRATALTTAPDAVIAAENHRLGDIAPETR